MDKLLSEHSRVREEIAKEFFRQTYQFTEEVEATKKHLKRIWAFSSWDEMNKGNRDAWRKLADNILKIKGIVILADDQELPAIAECGLNSYSIKETEDKCRITQDKMIRANFRRVL